MECAEKDQTYLICNPQNNTIWYLSNYYNVVWKYNNPVINGYNDVDIFLYNINMSLFANFSNIRNLNTEYYVYVDPNWMTGPAYVRLRPSAGQNDSLFNLFPDVKIYIAKNNTSTSIVSTPTSSSTPVVDVSPSSQNWVKPVLGSIIPVVVIVFLSMLFMYVKQRYNKNKEIIHMKPDDTVTYKPNDL